MTKMNPADPLQYAAALRRQRTRAPRVVLYSHDTLGFGHLRRNMLLAQAIRDCGHDPEVLLVAGMREAGAFALPAGVDCLTLPAYAKASDGTGWATARLDPAVTARVRRDMPVLAHRAARHLRFDASGGPPDAGSR